MCLFKALFKTVVISLPVGDSFKRDELNFGNSVGSMTAAERSCFHCALLETDILFRGSSNTQTLPYPVTPQFLEVSEKHTCTKWTRA